MEIHSPLSPPAFRQCLNKIDKIEDEFLPFEVREKRRQNLNMKVKEANSIDLNDDR